MTHLDDDPYAPDAIDDEEISRMIDGLFMEADERSTFGWALPESSGPDLEPSTDAFADAERKRAVRAFGHQIRLTRRAAGFRTTGELAFAMRTLGIKITGATIGNWERGFVLPDSRTLSLAEQTMRTEGALLDSLHELIGDDEATIDPTMVEASPDVHTRLRLDDIETRLLDVEDEVGTLRAEAIRRGEARPTPAAPATPGRGWLSRLRTAPTHHHSGGPYSGSPHSR